MKELQPNILDDYEHLITRGIDNHGREAGFPQLEAAGIERQQLDDFLFEVQRALDSQGSQKAQLTKYGIVVVVPVLVLSAFPEAMLPWGHYSLFVGLAIGLLLALLWKGLSVLVVKQRIARLRRANPELAAFADKVERFMKEKAEKEKEF